MKLTRGEFCAVAALILGWACLPLGIHFLAPEFSDRTGEIMLVGGAVTAAMALVLFFRRARRLTDECNRRLEAQGFAVVAVAEAEVAALIPFEHRHQLPKLDSFASGAEPGKKEAYRREHHGMSQLLFAYDYRIRSEPGRAGFVACRFESPGWNWPAFSAAMAGRWSQTGEVPGWTRIEFPEDKKFSKSCWLQAPRVDFVCSLFWPEIRRLLLEHRGLRLAGEGPMLTVYAGHLRLVPGEAERFLEQAGAFVTRFADLARKRSRE